ncbi:TonB-dependent receptor [Stakelama saccharophila]|uniref:TonB-dependent receptor n=1 Tax=Stakelama saccharophila TaxID=3075605 RepID=A0ABZ0B8I1_9SPHN|nr:TonB-dependent receptor [Stakelama sp. W311]WNO53721.1 TonB-dependent receptor [Stakelama sp. W311]
MSKSRQTTAFSRQRRLCAGLMASAAALLLLPHFAQAQDARSDDDRPPASDNGEQQGVSSAAGQGAGDIVVTGIRATQRNSIEVKRNANVIVDAIVSDEIGATPDQSVGETLERIVGVTADRFKGSASEISIRGLGPFLGFSTLNGREVTSGSGDRSVSFQQFPSELVNGVLVYKSQNASLVEGGTSGIIDLRTLRPLDYGHRRLQAEIRGTYEAYDDKIKGRNGLGYRGSVSYTDQFKLGDGDFGISIGYERADESAPEDFYTESSTSRPCNTIGGGTDRCSYDPESGNPYYFVQNSYLFRQMNNNLTRDAVIGSVQYMPRPELDINLDAQFSRRGWTENRSDLVVAEGRRGITPIDRADNGALNAFSGQSRLESQTRIRDRDEDYYGGGASVEWTDDAAKIGVDVSYSQTKRDQVDRQTRLRTSETSGYDHGRIPYTLDKRSGEPVLTLDPGFDVNDHDLYDDASYARRRAEYRNDKIFAVRLDGTAFVADSFIRSFQGGLRYSDHRRVADLDNANDVSSVDDALIAEGNSQCRINFREKDFMGDSSSNIHSWAEFDPLCTYTTFAGSEDLGPATDPRSTSDINVTEKIMAGYAMANFGTSDDRLGGNVGVRIVNTTVRSVGYRGAFDATLVNGSYMLTPTGGFDTVIRKNNFTNVLPSLNVKYLAAQNFLVRGAIYRAISRPNIEDMGAGRDFSLENSDTNETIADAVAGVQGGNPQLEPLKSWNGDLSFEYYPNQTNLISLALFYKQLQAGVISADAYSNMETFTINGQPVTVPVAQQTNDDSKSDLWGLEINVSQEFTFLPSPFDGFGVTAGYTYADTDFEYEDPSAVDPDYPLRLFTDPASIIGLSHHTFSGQLYYEKGPASLRLLYKYRSDYLKPYQLTANRYATPYNSLDFSAQFKLTDNLRLRFDASNLLNEPQILSRPVPGAVSEVSYYGRRYNLGLKLRL